ncbi:galactokinase [Ferruginibacter lapsinanis]|uniref:galactokinase n=1 Tax=Ferruginibacter lapsinanis TaxID=563172 RepID=UPI001E4F0E65|nr:galactokinase [Ferruginibacter lapsinanis]UEG50578.1 galactokinase [Ferruginibacter lapsinanis]
MNSIASRIQKIFSESFSVQPQLFFSPGRINLIGEHVDYNDGFVMPAAINKGVYYAVAQNGTDECHFYAIDFDEWFSINIHEIKKINSWKNYVLSVVNEFLLLKKSIKGFNCVFSGDIPRGSGISSSAAVEGGLAFALNELFNCGLSRVELARLCQRAEHNFPNVKCGIMDQFANMMGKKDNVLLLDCKNLEHQYFPLQLDGYKIVLLNTKVHHSLASGEYNVRRQRCEEGLAILQSKLNIQSFRDIYSAERIISCKDEMKKEVYDCCQYVIEEILRTKKAAELLQQHDLIGFGKLMYATHEGLSKLYQVSCPELDFLVEQTLDNVAVIGSRMMGGGFGGCTINIIAADAIEGFIEKTGKAYLQKFNLELEAYITETGDGTSEILFTN